jgi:hypothetical protein
MLRLLLTARAWCLALAVAAGLVAAAPLAAQDRGAESRPVIDIEKTYYDQPQLLERELSKIKSSTPGRPRLYFVGFAGWGTQAVFKREVLAVRQLFDVQYGTSGRSLMLVNHWTTLAEVPMANSTNLDRALRHIGRLMNKDDDILFLFMTSHGMKGRFAVEMTGFGFRDLTPGWLRGALDRSGIKNRVVVVSACHSGSFVAALAEPNTLVLTAAHADRTSFGCDDRREWTYFGDAFFNRALRQERSFEKAFERARQLIGRWETKDKLVPSLPQIAGGEALHDKLAALVDQEWEPPQE